MNILPELLRRVDAMNGSHELRCAAAIVGLAVDLGAVSLPEALAIVGRCGSYDELSARLTTLADDARMFIDDPLPVGCPPGHEHRVFRITGEREEVPTWTR